MNLDQVRLIAEENIKPRRFHAAREPGYIYYHGRRVAALAEDILAVVNGERSGARSGEHSSGDDPIDPVLYAGALFHDVGKGFAPHNEVGADIARSLLKDCCSADEIEGIRSIIWHHCLRKKGHELENRELAVQDADLIDHFGTQDVWLSFLHAAHHGESPQQVVDWWRSEESQKMTKRLRGLLNFDVSTRLYDERFAYFSQFAERFAIEAEGRIPDGVLNKAGDLT